MCVVRLIMVVNERNCDSNQSSQLGIAPHHGKENINYVYVEVISIYKA